MCGTAGPTNNVVLGLPPVEICDALLPNKDDLALEAHLLQLSMSLLSLHNECIDGCTRDVYQASSCEDALPQCCRVCAAVSSAMFSTQLAFGDQQHMTVTEQTQ